MARIATCGAMLLALGAGLPACKKGAETPQTADAGTASVGAGPWAGGGGPADGSSGPSTPEPPKPPAIDAAPAPAADAGGTAVPAADGSGSTIYVGGAETEQETQQARALLQTGIELAKGGKCREAIDQGFAKVAELFEARFGERRATVRCGRSSTQALGQGLEAALGGGDVIVLGSEWPDALYYTAYCLIELGDQAQAKVVLYQALERMPDDPMYLCELGDVLLRARDWPPAVAAFERAQASAEALAAEPDGAAISPGGRTPVQWQTRALRGQGYAAVELGALDRAEQAYRQALALDPSDEQSKKELEFIAGRRQGGTP